MLRSGDLSQYFMAFGAMDMNKDKKSDGKIKSKIASTSFDEMPESSEMQDQLMFMMSMSPLMTRSNYFDMSIKNPLRKLFTQT